MTGESDERKKETFDVCMDHRAEKEKEKSGLKTYGQEAHLLPSPIILSGTNVAGGEGKMISIVVGECSALGEILKTLVTRVEETPLQKKLDKIATDVGLVGTYFALLTVHALMIRYFVDGLLYRSVDLFGGEDEGGRLFWSQFSQWVDFFIIGVAIIVVAVPEGLPLAVMISLAFSITKMMKDNNYVKRLAACEIMGGADNICSDKTGTLTMNQMKVVKVWVGKNVDISQEQDADKNMVKINFKDYLNDIHADHISMGIACNTPEKIGATDRGMVEFI